MIKINAYRFKDGSRFQLSDGASTPSKALQSFVIYELAYGGQIDVLEPDHIVVKTSVMGCLDVTEFTASTPELLKPLYDFASMYVMYNRMVAEKEGRDVTDQEIQNVMDITKGMPLLVTMASGMIIGKSRVKSTILLSILQYAPADIIQDPAAVEQLAKRLVAVSGRDLLVMYDMITVGNEPFETVLELIN